MISDGFQGASADGVRRRGAGLAMSAAAIRNEPFASASYGGAPILGAGLTGPAAYDDEDGHEKQHDVGSR